MTKHEYICTITEAASLKSTCDRAAVGSVIVTQDYEVITTGYNGAPKGLKNCSEVGHLMVNGHCLRTTHAELNSIIQAGKHGVSIKGCMLYTTVAPCYECAKAIINAGIIKVCYKAIRYREGIELLIEAGIKVQKWDE